MLAHASGRVSLDHALNFCRFRSGFCQISLRTASVFSDHDNFCLVHILTTIQFSHAKPNLFGGIVPNAASGDETSISEHVEKIQGEVALDSYVKSQTSAPEVVKRITELENSLWRLAHAVRSSVDVDHNPTLRGAVEEATLTLKNRLEIDDRKHRFRTELGPFPDNLRLLKD